MAATALGCTQAAEVPSEASNAVAAAATRVVNSVEFRLEAPAVTRARTPVPVVLTVKNGGKEPIELAISDVREFDVAVHDANGALVWRRSGTQPTKGTAVVQPALAPGEARRWEVAWDQLDSAGRAVRAGRYSIEGTFTGWAFGGILVGPVVIDIRD